MPDELNQIEQEARKLLESVENLKQLKDIRVKMLGRKGALTIFLRSLKDLPLEKRKTFGPKAQSLKKELEKTIDELERQLSEKEQSQRLDHHFDVTRPGIRSETGRLHPLSIVEEQAIGIFERMGFGVAEGPDIETEHYNFNALNIPEDHPARDLWDTFWLKMTKRRNKRPAISDKLLLRTHTSPVQVRYMEQNPPPLRIVVPGTTFRHEAIDATHSIQFLQLEGLLVDRHVSIAHFKAVIQEFLSEFFSRRNKKEEVKVRLRPSYFPFVEPGFEVDAFYDGQWLEMMGAGMVHPNVFKSAGLNPGDWQGFAFGMGIDRLAMVKYGINDIRLFYENDIRFLKQF